MYRPNRQEKNIWTVSLGKAFPKEDGAKMPDRMKKALEALAERARRDDSATPADAS